VRVLLSAYACGPGVGSEPEIGLRAVLAAATKHEVWVLTQPEMAEATRRWLVERDFASRVAVLGIGPDHPGDRHDGLKGLWRAHVTNDRWQRIAAQRAVELDAHINFDVVHHVTLAAYWLRTGVSVLDKPLVWGPVGGGVEVPWRLLTQIGGRGLLEESLRSVTRRTAARVPAVRKVATRAAIVLAQNADTARRLPPGTGFWVLSNALATDLPAASMPRARTKEVLVVGRLVPWKGHVLALRAMRHVRTPGAVLHIIGDGFDRGRLVAAAQRLGVQGRVRFLGEMAQPDLFDRLSHAGVLLHPSLHEEAGCVVAEALSLGTPLVCLDRGGPRVLSREWPAEGSILVPATDWPGLTARHLADAVDAMLAAAPPVLNGIIRPRTSFSEALLRAYEDAATNAR
jgi:glycosyltransferase involved in cell wall biosynthesis